MATEIEYTLNEFSQSGSIKDAFNAIYLTLDNPEAQKALSEMVGVKIGQSPVQNFNTQIFYAFWNGYRRKLESSAATAFVEPANIFESYLARGGSAQQMNNANLVVTYIFVLFFNTIPPGRLDPPKISAKPGTRYYSPLTETVSRLYQISEATNTKGAGNYLILSKNDNTLTSIINSTKLQSPNTGYIAKLCLREKNQFFAQNPSASNEDYRNLVSKIPSAGTWCGCFTPLSDSIKNLISDKTSGNFNPECDPLCYNPKALGLYNTYGNGTQGGSKKDCRAQVCVIDNVNVSSYSSTGGASFNQICSGCASGASSGCLCFLNTSEQTVLSGTTSDQSGGMPNQANFKRNCPNATCFEMDSNDNATEVECNKQNTPATSDVFRISTNGIAGVENKTNPTNLFWVFVIGIAAALVLFFVGVIELELKF